ncbi:MAG: signal recognition particle-docking protein FtsY [Verrucomicrobiota bacterium]
MKKVPDKMVGMFKGWVSRMKHGAVDWDELEATLIQCDLGLPLTEKILQRLQKSHLSAVDVQEAAVAEIKSLWGAEARSLDDMTDMAETWLIVGVNGVGKTTSIAKLAHRYKKMGRKIHLVAADTFRAAAIDQLKIWAERIDVSITCGTEGGDPGAAAYQGLEEAEAKGADLVLIDTAGRLHNKDNLMRELEKVKRVIGKKHEEAPHETLLVVDAGNGTNSLEQARQFHRGVTLTGVIVTKLDSSAKGGVVAAMRDELDLDTVMVGLGEGMDDLVPFRPQTYVEQFFG